MKTQKQWINYQELELIAIPLVKQCRSQILLSVLRNIWDNLLLSLTISAEPQISQILSAEGTRWRIYNPQTGKSIVCESEQEVRSWLEECSRDQQIQSSDYFAPRQLLNRSYYK